MTPTHSIPSALVYQTLGHEVHTVVVDGTTLMQGGTLTGLSDSEEAQLLARAQQASEGIADRAQLTTVPL